LQVGSDAGDVLDSLIRGLEMPRSLGAVKIGRDNFQRIAVQAMVTPWVPRNPRPIKRSGSGARDTGARQLEPTKHLHWIVFACFVSTIMPGRDFVLLDIIGHLKAAIEGIEATLTPAVVHLFLVLLLLLHNVGGSWHRRVVA
jgi:hypothetical protein